jgi:hypothetical protein
LRLSIGVVQTFSLINSQAPSERGAIFGRSTNVRKIPLFSVYGNVAKRKIRGIWSPRDDIRRFHPSKSEIIPLFGPGEYRRVAGAFRVEQVKVAVIDRKTASANLCRRSPFGQDQCE